VFDLILDVMNGFWQLGDADTEGAKTLLPSNLNIASCLGSSGSTELAEVLPGLKLSSCREVWCIHADDPAFIN
jgi:hypothetical protein